MARVSLMRHPLLTLTLPLRIWTRTRSWGLLWRQRRGVRSLLQVWGVRLRSLWVRPVCSAHHWPSSAYSSGRPTTRIQLPQPLSLSLHLGFLIPLPSRSIPLLLLHHLSQPPRLLLCCSLSFPSCALFGTLGGLGFSGGGLAEAGGLGFDLPLSPWVCCWGLWLRLVLGWSLDVEGSTRWLGEGARVRARRWGGGVQPACCCACAVDSCGLLIWCTGR